MSADLRTAQGSAWTQNYPFSPTRFEEWYQVLGHELLSGKARFYWEVEWQGEVSVGVTYLSIERSGTGTKSSFGCNDSSWCLSCSSGGYSVSHNGDHESITLPSLQSLSYRVAVCVDCHHHTITFYRVDHDSLIELYVYKNRRSFKEPLCPSFGLGGVNSYVSLCNIWESL